MHKFSIIIIFFGTFFLCKNGASQCNNTGTDLQTVCDSLLWIDGVTYTIDNNTATHTLTNIAGCDSIVTLDLTIKNSSLNPSAVISSENEVCPNNDVYLNVDGGSLGTNSQWVWYKDSCSGISIDTGSSIVVTQSSNTTYFVRAEGECNNTNCENITVNNFPYFIELDSISIDSTFNSIDSTWSIIDTVCPQSAVKLFAHFSDTFPQGYTITWYENSCGASSIGLGDSIIV